MYSTSIIFIYILALFSISSCHGEFNETDPDTYLSRLIADLWLEGADVVRIVWRDCSKKVSIIPTYLVLQKLALCNN